MPPEPRPVEPSVREPVISPESRRDEAIALCRALGDPARDYAILGEGNACARIDETTFWITTSGSHLGGAGEDDLVRVDMERALAMLEPCELSDADVRQRLAEARVDQDGEAVPSVETVVHAVFLELEDVQFVGHTHPTHVNAITCSRLFAEALSGRLFPDEIVLCGPDPLLVPYVDPGVPLAQEIRRRLTDHLAAHRERPKVVYLQNHGLVALGRTAQQVLDITAMAVKAARILVGTYAVGGPEFLRPEDVARIHRRPDEHYRQRVLGQR
jgi:rhamnose utilization protein RhaD (predicted bifunctional aldolase and dehydrogenase)